MKFLFYTVPREKFFRNMLKKLVNLTLIQVKQILELEVKIHCYDADYQRIFANQNLINELENYILIRIPNIYLLLNQKQIECYQAKNEFGKQRTQIEALIAEKIKGKQVEKTELLI